MKQELPSLKPKEVIAALQQAGCSIKRQTGSHIILYCPNARRPISIPSHVKDISNGTLRAIIRQANLTLNEFLKCL